LLLGSSAMCVGKRDCGCGCIRAVARGCVRFDRARLECLFGGVRPAEGEDLSGEFLADLG
jgi:hypothetical protein